MNYKEKSAEWLSKLPKDDPLYKELDDIVKKSETDPNAEADIEDRFYKELSFGTAGLRGKIGVGTNRMNFYTVGRATQGIADYIFYFLSF